MDGCELSLRVRYERRGRKVDLRWGAEGKMGGTVAGREGLFYTLGISISNSAGI
jgi:hypothetical protein